MDLPRCNGMMKPCLVICAFMSLLLSTGAYAYTLTFDDVPAGNDFGQYYYSTFGVSFSLAAVQIVSRVDSDWWFPHSGDKALVVPSDSNRIAIALYIVPDNWTAHEPQYVSAIGAYFSTRESVVLQLVGFNRSFDNPVASAYIGAPGRSLDNEYVEIRSSTQNINGFAIFPVTDHAFLQFSLDDLTIIPVPEPSSLLALAAGVVPLAGRVRRRPHAQNCRTGRRPSS